MIFYVSFHVRVIINHAFRGVNLMCSGKKLYKIMSGKHH